MVWTSISEWSQKRKLRAMLEDPRSARGFRSTGQLEKGIKPTDPRRRPASRSRRKKVRRRRRVDVESALGRVTSELRV